MSEIDTRVDALRFELAQVKDHPVQEFRDRAKAIEAEIAEWERPGHPAEPAPSEVVEPEPEPEPEVVEPPVEPAKDDK